MPSGNVALERGNKVKQAKDGKGNLILLLEEYEDYCACIENANIDSCILCWNREMEE